MRGLVDFGPEHGRPGAQAIQIRVGIHVGEVTVKDNDQDIDGGEVHFASRVVGAIREAEIWLSDPAKRNIQTYGADRHRHLNWERHDGLAMKGFTGTFTLWSLAAPAASSLPVADQFPGSETFDGQAQTPSARAQPSKTGGDKPRGGIPSQPIPQEPTVVDAQSMEWDVFISHASEDKEAFVRPLAVALQKKDIRVWFDEFTLTVGDSLRRSIDRGLAGSRYGIVVLSPDFLKKDWPQKELDGLITREVDGRKVILPVWHNMDAKTLQQYSPLLADRVATLTAKGVEAVVADLMSAIASS